MQLVIYRSTYSFNSICACKFTSTHFIFYFDTFHIIYNQGVCQIRGCWLCRHRHQYVRAMWYWYIRYSLYEPVRYVGGGEVPWPSTGMLGGGGTLTQYRYVRGGGGVGRGGAGAGGGGAFTQSQYRYVREGGGVPWASTGMFGGGGVPIYESESIFLTPLLYNLDFNPHSNRIMSLWPTIFMGFTPFDLSLNFFSIFFVLIFALSLSTVLKYERVPPPPPPQYNSYLCPC